MFKRRLCLIPLIMLVYLTSACGSDNPYLGTWDTRSAIDMDFDLTNISKTNNINNCKMIFTETEWIATSNNMEHRGLAAYRKDGQGYMVSMDGGNVWVRGRFKNKDNMKLNLGDGIVFNMRRVK